MLSMTTYVLAAAVVVGQANQGPPKNEHLEQLKPMIGKWVGEVELQEGIPGVAEAGDQIAFTLIYRWSKNGQAILVEVIFDLDGKPVTMTNGIRAWDPVAKKIVGIDASMTGMARLEGKREKKTITFKSEGAEADGTKTSATFVTTIVSPEKRVISLTDRKKGDESLPDMLDIEMKRVKWGGKKKAAK